MRPSTARTATAFAAGFITGVVATGISTAVVMSTPGTTPLTFDLPTQTISAEPNEDDAAWDCRIHGNRICGPGAILPDGTHPYPGDYSGAHRVIASVVYCAADMTVLGCAR
jgi:hypothetical protein